MCWKLHKLRAVQGVRAIAAAIRNGFIKAARPKIPAPRFVSIPQLHSTQTEVFIQVSLQKSSTCRHVDPCLHKIPNVLQLHQLFFHHLRGKIFPANKKHLPIFLSIPDSFCQKRDGVAWLSVQYLWFSPQIVAIHQCFDNMHWVGLARWSTSEQMWSSHIKYSHHSNRQLLTSHRY